MWAEKIVTLSLAAAGIAVMLLFIPTLLQDPRIGRLMTLDQASAETEKGDVLAQIKEVFGEGPTGQKDRYRMVVATVSYRNPGIETVVLDLTRFAIQSEAVHTVIDPALLSYYNDEETSLFLQLEPDEEKQVNLPYVLTDFFFTKEGWARLDQRDFEVVYALYPDVRLLTEV